MAERIDVFISSTSRDLTRYRAKVKEVILNLGMHPIAMEEFQPSKDNALQKCYDELQQAEVFVGIYAHRYGYAPDDTHSYTTTNDETRTGDGKTGITHLEYLWALENNLPIYLFVLSDKDEDNEPLAWPLEYVEDEPGKTRLQAFKDHIKDQHVVRFFHSPDDLATKVSTALASESRKPDTHSKKSSGRDHLPFKLPENYVPREELLEELRLALLGDDDSVALTSSLTTKRTGGTAALHGMGGIGKTVMARALCDDPVVRAAFPDGVLWASIGQNPTDADLKSHLREWIEPQGGQVTQNDPTIDQLKANLIDLLKDRACLLVVDDVWQRKHGEAFRVGSVHCLMLLTTRNADVAMGLGAHIQPIPQMGEQEAVALLKQWADGKLANTDFDVCAKIVHLLGRLALAVKLAGAQLRRRTPEHWLERFDVFRLSDRSLDPDDPHSSLERCFGMSLNELDKVQRGLYAGLAIFLKMKPSTRQP